MQSRRCGKFSVKGGPGSKYFLALWVVWCQATFNPATSPRAAKAASKYMCTGLCASKTLFGKKKGNVQIFSLTVCDIETSGLDGRVDKTLEPQEAGTVRSRHHSQPRTTIVVEFCPSSQLQLLQTKSSREAYSPGISLCPSPSYPEQVKVSGLLQLQQVRVKPTTRLMQWGILSSQKRHLGAE